MFQLRLSYVTQIWWIECSESRGRKHMNIWLDHIWAVWNQWPCDGRLLRIHLIMATSRRDRSLLWLCVRLTGKHGGQRLKHAGKFDWDLGRCLCFTWTRTDGSKLTSVQNCDSILLVVSAKTASKPNCNHGCKMCKLLREISGSLLFSPARAKLPLSHIHD